MAPRLELQALLKDLLGSDNVYFEPPSSIVMQYPCIVYNRYRIVIAHANNTPYKHDTRYQVIVIDRDPDSVIVEKVAMLPKVAYDRFYTADGLNHDAFTLFF